MNRSDRIPSNRCTLFRATKAGIHQFESNWPNPKRNSAFFHSESQHCYKTPDAGHVVSVLRPLARE